YMLWYHLMFGRTEVVYYEPAPPRFTRLSQQVIPVRIYQQERAVLTGSNRVGGLSPLGTARGLSGRGRESLNRDNGAVKRERTVSGYAAWKQAREQNRDRYVNSVHASPMSGPGKEYGNRRDTQTAPRTTNTNSSGGGGARAWLSPVS